jgi:hypothetical protein
MLSLCVWKHTPFWYQREIWFHRHRRKVWWEQAETLYSANRSKYISPHLLGAQVKHLKEWILNLLESAFFSFYDQLRTLSHVEWVRVAWSSLVHSRVPTSWSHLFFSLPLVDARGFIPSRVTSLVGSHSESVHNRIDNTDSITEWEGSCTIRFALNCHWHQGCVPAHVRLYPCEVLSW